MQTTTDFLTQLLGHYSDNQYYNIGMFQIVPQGCVQKYLVSFITPWCLALSEFSVYNPRGTIHNNVIRYRFSEWCPGVVYGTLSHSGTAVMPT